MRGFHAPKRTRTSTGESPHKALNLARLPIPPPARERARTIATGRGGGDGMRRFQPVFPVPSDGVLPLRTHVRPTGQMARVEASPAMDLTKRQQEIFDFI